MELAKGSLNKGGIIVGWKPYETSGTPLSAWFSTEIAWLFFLSADLHFFFAMFQPDVGYIGIRS